MNVGGVVESKEDFYRWQTRFAPYKVDCFFELMNHFITLNTQLQIQQRQHSGHKNRRPFQKTNYHEFKRQPPKAPIFTKRIKVENDEPVQVKIEQRSDGAKD